MKLIIVEGLDRTGKNTLIQDICTTSSNYIVRHFQRPLGNTNEEKIEYQKQDFHKEYTLYKNSGVFSKYSNDLYIWNRAHIGEYVYGNLYRNYTADWIFNFEKIRNFDELDIYLILLYADAPFLVNHEDGNSFSQDIISKQKEIDLFTIACEKSIIRHKIALKVNNYDSYIPRDFIFDEVKHFAKL
jgi:hypothetical protein